MGNIPLKGWVIIVVLAGLLWWSYSLNREKDIAYEKLKASIPPIVPSVPLMAKGGIVGENGTCDLDSKESTEITAKDLIALVKTQLEQRDNLNINS